MVTGRASDRVDRGYGGVGEELGGRVAAGRGAFGGVGGEDGGLVWVAPGGERPPGQGREHPGWPGLQVDVPVVTGCRVEQGPGPWQVTEATGHRRLADHGVGRHPWVEPQADGFGVQGVGGFVVALPGSQRGQGDQAERHLKRLSGGPASRQERFVGRRGRIEVPPDFGDAGQGVQRRDDQQDLACGVEAFQARTGDWLGIFQPSQRQQVPRDDQVVHAEQPAVASWFQQIPGLAQGVE